MLTHWNALHIECFDGTGLISRCCAVQRYNRLAYAHRWSLGEHSAHHGHGSETTVADGSLRLESILERATRSPLAIRLILLALVIHLAILVHDGVLRAGSVHVRLLAVCTACTCRSHLATLASLDLASGRPLLFRLPSRTTQ